MPSLALVTLVASIISAMLISVDVDEFGYLYETSVNASWGTSQVQARRFTLCAQTIGFHPRRHMEPKTTFGGQNTEAFNPLTFKNRASYI